MASFFVAASFDAAKKHSPATNQQYSFDERKLMTDILYEDMVNKRAKVAYDRHDRHVMAEIARQNDLKSKANLAKQYTEKLQRLVTKREEMDALKIAHVKSKLKRVETMTKPDLLSETVKKYDAKRSEVLNKIREKEEEKKRKLERATNREKPDLLSDVTKRYDEKRAEVLGRIQQKEEETKLKLERKMHKVTMVTPDKSVLLSDNDKSYDKRRSEVIDRKKRMNEEKNLKHSKEFDPVENPKTRQTVKYQMMRGKSLIVDNNEHLKNPKKPVDVEHVHSRTEKMTNNKVYKENEDHSSLVQQPFFKNSVGMASNYNSFATNTALPPIGYN